MWCELMKEDHIVVTHHHNLCIYIKNEFSHDFFCIIVQLRSLFFSVDCSSSTFTWCCCNLRKEILRTFFFLSRSFICVRVRKRVRKEEKWNPRITISSNLFSLVYIISYAAIQQAVQIFQINFHSFIRLEYNGWAKKRTNTTSCLFT